MAVLDVLRRGIRKLTVDEQVREQEPIISEHFTKYSTRIRLRTSDSSSSFVSALFFRREDLLREALYDLPTTVMLLKPRNYHTYRRFVRVRGHLNGRLAHFR